MLGGLLLNAQERSKIEGLYKERVPKEWTSQELRSTNLKKKRQSKKKAA